MARPHTKTCALLAWARGAAWLSGLLCCEQTDPSQATSAAVSSAGARADRPTPVVGNSSDLDFEGLPAAARSSARAPEGCAEAQANANGVLLRLRPLDHTLTLSARGGQLLVNGTACAGVIDAAAIEIVGTNAGDTIVIDLSGELPKRLRAGSLHVDTGKGTGLDTVALSMTRDDDVVTLGEHDNQLRLALGPQLPRLRIENQARLIVSTGPGNDRVDASGGPSVGGPVSDTLIVYGGADSDVIQGGRGTDQLHGGDGDDCFTTAAISDGADLYDGGSGVDRLSYENRTAPLTVKLDNRNDDGEAGEHDDVGDTVEVLLGGRGDDTLWGSANDDTIVGGPGDDSLYGGGGDDVFIEASVMNGHDIMNGGAGIDSVDYSERAAALHVTLCASSSTACTGSCQCAADNGEAGEKDTLVNIENVNGGRGNDLLQGSAADNVLFGSEGDDVLRGEGGHDELYGGDGDDLLNGGDGDDLLNGDDGVDVIDGGGGDDDLCIWELTEHAQSCER